MAEPLTDIWTSDGGCFTVLAELDVVQDHLEEEAERSGWLRCQRVTWQDPLREGGPVEHWPLVEETTLAVRISAVTALTRSGPGTAASLHRARAESLS